MAARAGVHVHIYLTIMPVRAPDRTPHDRVSLRPGSRAKERPQVVEPVEFWSAPSAPPTVRGMLLGWSRPMCRPRQVPSFT